MRIVKESFSTALKAKAICIDPIAKFRIETPDSNERRNITIYERGIHIKHENKHPDTAIIIAFDDAFNSWRKSDDYRKVTFDDYFVNWLCRAIGVKKSAMSSIKIYVYDNGSEWIRLDMNFVSLARFISDRVSVV